jgi:hypothetical protein
VPAGFSPPPGPAQAGAETERPGGSPAAAPARGVLVPALVATVIGLAFVVRRRAPLPGETGDGGDPADQPARR